MWTGVELGVSVGTEEEHGRLYLDGRGCGIDGSTRILLESVLLWIKDLLTSNTPPIQYSWIDSVCLWVLERFLHLSLLDSVGSNLEWARGDLYWIWDSSFAAQGIHMKNQLILGGLSEATQGFPSCWDTQEKEENYKT